MYQFVEEEIGRIIKNVAPPERASIKQIVKKALSFDELDLYEIDSLLKTYTNNELLQYVIKSAGVLKETVFGNKIKIYIPVYITSQCVNNCIYCGFRRDNRALRRKRLSLNQFEKELEFVLNIGHRTIELVLGNDPELNGEKLAPYVETTAEKLNEKGGGSIILMSEPMDTEDYKILRKAGLTEVYCWQETYNPQRYRQIHPEGTHKHNYQDRVTIFDRIIEAGVQRYGMGILFGLYDWEYDMLALLRHAKWLTKTYRVTPYAFGIPRLKKAEGALLQEPFYKVTDEMYRLAVAVYRLAFPTTHTYMNTRESLNLILDLLEGGGSEVNIEASTVPGGYSGQFQNGEQFFHYSYDSGQDCKRLEDRGFQVTFR